jgi:16S rRNA (cytidine1402-2'-O)-methyltransferase
MPTKNNSVTRQNMHYYTHPAQRAKISMITTPIGNLSDITPRSIEALEGCDELWCEDTRHTQNLLNALQISRQGDHLRLRRFDQHTDEKDLLRLLERVEAQGQWIGVVTDAGVPGISDPGAKIVQNLSSFPGIKIEPVPGASAVSSMVSIAGFQDNSFYFKGFFPRERKEALEVLDALDETGTIFFESPKRIKETVETLKLWAQNLDFVPKFCFAKELTKIHETIYSGTGVDFIEFLLGQDFDERGEWVFSIELYKDSLKNKKVVTEWELTLECLIEAEIPTKKAAQMISSKFNIAKNLAYQKALDLQKK